MGLYFILASIILAVSAGITFSTKTVSHKQTLVCVFLFPLVYLASGLPLAGIAAQIATAAIAYVVFWALRKRGGIGGGVVNAVTIAVLYVPTLSQLFNFLCLAGILGGALTLLVMAIKRDTNVYIRDYAAVIMAACSGFFLYQYSDLTSKNSAPHDVQTAAAPASDVRVFGLRGLSD